MWDRGNGKRTIDLFGILVLFKNALAFETVQRIILVTLTRKLHSESLCIEFDRNPQYSDQPTKSTPQYTPLVNPLLDS